MRPKSYLGLALVVVMGFAALEAYMARVPGRAAITEKPAVVEEVTYSVIKREVLPPPSGALKLDVRLNEKASAHALGVIAGRLKEEFGRDYTRVFIFYYPSGMEVGRGAWATSHFTPALEVKIAGPTAADEKRLLARFEPKPGQTIIGEWLHDDPFIAARWTIYEEGGRVYLDRLFKDGSRGKPDELVQEETPEGTRFRRKAGSRAEEYYLLDNHMDLQIWDKDGSLGTGRRIR